ncbi:MAG TPA: hypothetical protein VIT90_18700 [Lysobacter sp.]
MTIETVPGTTIPYYLVTFDAKGRERDDDADGRMSEHVLKALRDEQPSDVFLFIHGWKGDIPAARKQYGAWMGAMLALAGDRQRAEQNRPGFKPLLVGLHWPSLPFGDESFDDGASFAPGAVDDIATQIDRCAEQIADTPAARAALRTILEAAQSQFAPAALHDDVRDAYAVLDRESGMGAEGVGGDPGADRERFDADAAYADALDEAASFGGGGLRNALLSPLVQLSFWKMKDRARAFGENGGFAFLTALMHASDGRDVRIHLMGHSFGCIAASASVGGPAGRRLPRPVHSLVLVQGALSLWSYCASIPSAAGKQGYFRQLISEHAVAGPIVTTQSSRDMAVGSLYPAAAGVARQVAFAPGELPKYGGIGTFGLRGDGLDIVDLQVRGHDASYGFQPGRIYNVECSTVIREGGPPSGAHSDIARPEVAHLVWAAAL